MINITKYINVTDCQTNEVWTYDNIKLCAMAFNVGYTSLTVYVDKNRYFKNRYKITTGDYHDKKIKVGLTIDKGLYNDLQKITDNVPSSTVYRLASAICKDFVFNYHRERNNNDINNNLNEYNSND